jgi:hypothetical protein
MTCSRCSAEAAVKRDSAFYCGKCAMARDWEEIIAVVQADRVERATVQFGAAAPASAPSPAPETNGHEHHNGAPEPQPASVGASDELPADPFG